MNAPGDDREGFAAFLLRMRGKGFGNKTIAAAIEATPRRSFIPTQFQEHAWSDSMLPIECGEAIESIDLQASAIAALAIEPGHRVLEVGAGSGYTAAVMARLGGRVVALERYKTLANLARQRFEALEISTVSVRHADGANGLAAEGPYDRIIVWAAFEGLPRQFVDQLASGGVLIAPIGEAESQQALAKLTKVGSRFDREDISKVRLQPLIPGLAAAL